MNWRPITGRPGLRGYRSEPANGMYFEIVQHGESEWHLYLYLGCDDDLVACTEVGEKLGLTPKIVEEVRFWYCKVYKTAGEARAACRRVVAIVQEVIRQAGENL